MRKVNSMIDNKYLDIIRDAVKNLPKATDRCLVFCRPVGVVCFELCNELELGQSVKDKCEEIIKKLALDKFISLLGHNRIGVAVAVLSIALSLEGKCVSLAKFEALTRVSELTLRKTRRLVRDLLGIEIVLPLKRVRLKKDYEYVIGKTNELCDTLKVGLPVKEKCVKIIERLNMNEFRSLAGYSRMVISAGIISIAGALQGEYVNIGKLSSLTDTASHSIRKVRQDILKLLNIDLEEFGRKIREFSVKKYGEKK
jgi:transcription initiation factor TFIIIB Brf1 subunit/transcription initiation factor TFIIB